MVPILSFVGASGSGKTSILEKVVAELTDRGIRVAVFKHTHHEMLHFDQEGKDSYRYGQAGARTVVLSSAGGMMLVKKTGRDLTPQEISEYAGKDIDLIITEGFKGAHEKKVEVHRKTVEPRLLTKPDQLLFIITDEKLNIDVSQLDFNKDNTIKIADLIQEWMAGKDFGR